MAEMAKSRVDGEIGCGFMGGIFRRRSYWPRKTSVHSLLSDGSNDVKKAPNTYISKEPQRSSASGESACIVSNSSNPSTSHRRSSTSSSSANSGQMDSGDERKPKREPARKSTELSSNVMLIGHLGNLKQTGKSLVPNPRNGFGKISGNGAIMGNIMRKNSDEFRQFQGVVNKLDPEKFKCMGNEAFKQGRFDEALALYDRAIALDSNKSSYHSNKSAALMGLGRLVEAIFECREAIRIEPSYHRAHHRLAKLYLRYSMEAKNININIIIYNLYISLKKNRECNVLCLQSGRSREGNISLQTLRRLCRRRRHSRSSGSSETPQRLQHGS